MKTIVLASENPVKARAVMNGFQRMFSDERFYIQSVTIPSGVKDQPTSDAEALLGAYNRACGAAQTSPKADYWVGVEGGIEPEGDDVAAFAWVVIKSGNIIGKARTGTFFLPPVVSELIRQGMELGDADDLVFGRLNSKQENGAVGILTGDVIDRAQLYEQAVILSLVPFKNPDLFIE